MKKNQAAAELSQQIHRRKGELEFILGTEKHQLWMLTSEEAPRLNNLCDELEQFHLADGHHRYASTLNTVKESLSPTLLFSFLVTRDQVQNAAFTWAIKDPQLAKQLSENISPESICEKEVANIEIKMNGNHIYCQATRSLTVSSYIVEKLLGITAQQKIDLKSLIDYFPPGELSPEKWKAYPAVIDYKPLSVDKIISLQRPKKSFRQKALIFCQSSPQVYALPLWPKAK